jgi:hypothetical protein
LPHDRGMEMCRGFIAQSRHFYDFEHILNLLLPSDKGMSRVDGLGTQYRYRSNPPRFSGIGQGTPMTNPMDVHSDD